MMTFDLVTCAFTTCSLHSSTTIGALSFPMFLAPFFFSWHFFFISEKKEKIAFASISKKKNELCRPNFQNLLLRVFVVQIFIRARYLTQGSYERDQLQCPEDGKIYSHPERTSTNSKILSPEYLSPSLSLSGAFFRLLSLFSGVYRTSSLTHSSSPPKLVN